MDLGNQSGNRVKSAFFVAPYNDPKRPLLTWKMEIGPKFAGRRVRRFFSEKEAAEQEGERLVKQILDHGAQSLENDGLTTRKAVEWFSGRMDWRRKMGKISERHARDTKKFIKLLADAHGSKPIEFVTAEEVEKIVHLATTPSTQANYFSALHAFFQACEDFQKIKRNPMRALEKPKPKPRRNILTPEQMKAVLDLQDQMQPWMFASLILSAFVGVRSIEILRMNWEDIDTKTGQIHIREDVAKKTNSDGYDDRIIDFEPQLTRRKKFLKGEGKLIPVAEDKFYEERNRLLPLLEWEKWPENALRHSAATYKLAQCRNPAIVANMLGHKSSIRLVMTTYTVPAKKADWKAWRAL